MKFGCALVGACLAVLAIAGDAIACDPAAKTDTVKLRDAGVALSARIDRTAMTRHPLGDPRYCEDRAQFIKSLSVQMDLDGRKVTIEVRPLPVPVNLCKLKSEGLDMIRQSRKALLFSDHGENEQIVLCQDFRGAGVTLTCFEQAKECELWSVRELAPGCHAFFNLTILKTDAADWTDVMAAAHKAVWLTAACNRETRTRPETPRWKT